MQNKFHFFFFMLVFFHSQIAKSSPPKISKFHWGNLEVVYLADERFPTYQGILYFADGALADGAGREGESSYMFSQLLAGTKKYDQKELSEFFDFFGVTLTPNVTHEHSTLSFAGMTKDIVPTWERICHVFKEANFPKDEWEQEKLRTKSVIENILLSPGSLAERAIRLVTLENTPYRYPAEGILKSVDHIGREHLQEKLDYFNQKVMKRLYLSGPKEILRIQEIVEKECPFQEGKFIRQSASVAQTSEIKIILVPIEGNNQAQLRVGEFLSKNELLHPDLMQLSSHILGGGFTSLLMQELRVKKGLTYGASAMASPQRDYGRVVISTSTKNEGLKEVMESLRAILKNIGQKAINPEELQKSVDSLSGRYLFGFESSAETLSTHLFYDHLNRNYQEIYDFPAHIKVFTVKDLQMAYQQIFSWDKMMVVVVGDPSLAKVLEAFGKVSIRPYQDFL